MIQITSFGTQFPLSRVHLPRKAQMAAHITVSSQLMVAARRIFSATNGDSDMRDKPLLV